MFTHSKMARYAAVGTLVVLGGVGFSAHAEEPVQNLGPVGPHVPIMTTVGSKGVIAFYEPDGTHCGLYAVVYTLMTAGAFGVLAAAGTGGERQVLIDDLSGLAARSPLLAAAMTLFMVSLAGLPLTAGFFAKLYVFTAALDAGYAWVAVTGVLASVVSAYYYFRVAYTMYVGQPRGDVAIVGGRWTEAALIAAAAGVLILGIIPAGFASFVQQVGEALK